MTTEEMLDKISALTFALNVAQDENRRRRIECETLAKNLRLVTIQYETMQRKFRRRDQLTIAGAIMVAAAVLLIVAVLNWL